MLSQFIQKLTQTRFRRHARVVNYLIRLIQVYNIYFEMQSALVNELCQNSGFSAKLISVLDNLRKSINNRWSKTAVKQVQHHLISLTCQNKNLLHYKYLQEKSNNERCLANIIQILINTAKMSKQSRQNIAFLFLSHILSHTSCYISYNAFYVVLESVPQMLMEIAHQTLIDINSKLKKQQNAQNFKTLESIALQQQQIFAPQNIQLCQNNLDNYLWNHNKQINNPQKQKERNEKVVQAKIPPLIIPISKSINSSRHSALSKDDKKKGLVNLQKLASNLGEGFITVELGCLLANKRTRQVQQFSQNQTFRQKCLQKLDQIQTQRLNSSRLTMHKGNVGQSQQVQENAKKYYRKVLTINLNICLKKLPQKFKIMEWINKKLDASKKKTQVNTKQTESTIIIHYINQIIDMNLVGIINLQIPDKSKSGKKQSKEHESHSDIFGKLIRNLKTIGEVTKQIMEKICIQVEKLHLNLLLNRNKEQANSHFGFQPIQIQISDEFLGEEKLKINEQPKIQGPWKDYRKICSIKKYSDPILLRLGSWLQSLQQLADMGHPMFYYYQKNILKTIAFYLNTCSTKVTSYYFVQYIFKLFLMIKRQLIELSHPFLVSKDTLKNSNTKSPLTYKYPQLISYFLVILTSLLQGANKHLQKLIANIFIKNIFFMETIKDFLQFAIQQENVESSSLTLQFYKKALQVYIVSNRKNQLNKINQNSAAFYLFQHIADFLDPKNGCLGLALTKYESFISPANLQQYDEQAQGSTSQKSLSNAQSGLLRPAKSQQNNIQRYLHQILLFISHVYYLACPTINESHLVLEQQISSFYIKYAIMHFIKLYSLLTVNELANISESNAKNQLDYMLSTKQSPHPLPKINTKQIFMIDFLKILTNLSISRTPQIAKKFRQYRVLQFFVRQIQLEFCVKQNIEKYIKRAVKIRNVKQVLTINKQKELKKYKEINEQRESESKNSNKNSAPQKKSGVPGLNLTGQIFRKTTQQSKSKDLNNGINQKGKKLVPSLNIPIKTEQSHADSRQSKQKNKKGFLDDMLDEIVPKNKKKSFKQELNLKLDGLNLGGNKQRSIINKSRSPKQACDSSMIYYTQRKIRKIYSNKILHAESIMLILTLVLYRGQLDPIYCDQLPIIHGKLNVLYILHYHLNHDRNRSIIPILAESVSKIKPSLSGQRLLKLLTNQFTNLNHYHNWTKINAGAFGVILSAKTNLIEPKEVAIKQMNFPKSIYERCALVDIFTQITSLQMFRLQQKVTRMYNYGVSDNTYVVIMKKYACSLREWRLGSTQSPQASLFPPTLPNILSLFYEVIKGLKLLHEQNVTHYDIKGDNILLQFVPSSDPKQQPKVNVVFADFGVAKIYEDEKDELDLKSRGTQCIKSPQMLTLTLKNKKQSDNYDRRKKIGTTKASDIWSLGCLLYEIVTGQFLFNSNDWVHFFMLVTSPNEQLLNAQNCQKMKNNIYLIDFIKYILIRDPQHRPSIQSIICRFQSLYSLLVSNPQRTASSNLRQISSKSLQTSISDYYDFIKKQQKGIGLNNVGLLDVNKRLKSEEQFGRTGKVMQFFNPKFSGKITKIMQDMYFCERENQVIEYQAAIFQEGITHIIIEQKSKINKNKFKVIQIQLSDNNHSMSSVYRASPRVSDVLRQVLLLKGKLLFVNSQTNFCMNLLIFTLSYWFKCTAYQTWCLINTQILQFPALTYSIISMSRAVSMTSNIQRKVQQMPKLQCICGSVTIILKNKFQQKRGELKVCRCKRNKVESSTCFSKNCPAYLDFIRKRYNIVWDHLTWTLVGANQLLTPLFNPTPQQIIQAQILLNSADPTSNMRTDSKQKDEWQLFQCKTCDMWILATNGKQIWLILNNLIKFCSQGIMIPNAQQDFKSRTPALNYYTLSKLHMTTQ